MSATVAERNLAAEVRAVEAGHRAHLIPGGAVRVVSDTHHDKHYVVTFAAAHDGTIRFCCDPHGTAAYRDDHLHAESADDGLLPCMHAALAARRLERAGLASLSSEGRWVLSERARHVHDFTTGDCSCGEPADPFSGLPR